MIGVESDSTLVWLSVQNTSQMTIPTYSYPFFLIGYPVQGNRKPEPTANHRFNPLTPIVTHLRHTPSAPNRAQNSDCIPSAAG